MLKPIAEAERFTVKKKMVKTFLRFETALVKRLKVEE